MIDHTPEQIAAIAEGLTEAQRKALLGDGSILSAKQAGLMQQDGLISMRFFGHSLGADLTETGLAVRQHLKGEVQ